MKSKARRSLAKTLTWRVLATTDTFIILGLLLVRGSSRSHCWNRSCNPRCFCTMVMKDFGTELLGPKEKTTLHNYPVLSIIILVFQLTELIYV